ncbi:hypothetical protein GCM10023189_43100 [Nibrella saemangeumensis]|uniref:Uncharacterized protein n=1 Tax=Nibrella saemangeumensis TaxID=1084526 RepID=A0ABP8NDN1_9BACT
MAGKKYAELADTDEIVVEVAGRSVSVGGKQKKIENDRQLVVSKAWYEDLERDKDGDPLQFPQGIKLLGIPKYKEVNDAMGRRREYTVEPFAEAKKA